jgi:adiponectin receptor
VALVVQRLQRVLAPEVLAARWPFYTFLAGAMLCLLFSTVSHTLHCVSQQLSSFIWYRTSTELYICKYLVPYFYGAVYL